MIIVEIGSGLLYSRSISTSLTDSLKFWPGKEERQLEKCGRQCLAKDRALRFSTLRFSTIVEMQKELIGALRRCRLCFFLARSPCLKQVNLVCLLSFG